jgi:hypothetical protein
MLRASSVTSRAPPPAGFTAAWTIHGRDASSEPSLKSSWPARGRVRLRWIFSNDDQVAALEADLGEIATVEAERAQAIEPAEQGREVLLHAALVAATRVVHGRQRRRARGHRSERRRQGPLLRAGGNRDPAVGFDPDREHGADEIDPFGAGTAAEQARAGKADLGLGCAGDHRSVAVAHRDVADAHGGAAMLVALQHRAPDLDAKLVAKVFSDRSGEPWRDDVEGNRAARQAPPQRRGDQQAHRESARYAEADAAHPAPPHDARHDARYLAYGAIEEFRPPPQRPAMIRTGNVSRAAEAPAQPVRLVLACHRRALGLGALMHVQARLDAVQGSEPRSFRLRRHTPSDAPRSAVPTLS